MKSFKTIKFAGDYRKGYLEIDTFFDDDSHKLTRNVVNHATFNIFKQSLEVLSKITQFKRELSFDDLAKLHAKHIKKYASWAGNERFLEHGAR
jgi:hypothetical protein